MKNVVAKKLQILGMRKLGQSKCSNLDDFDRKTITHHWSRDTHMTSFMGYNRGTYICDMGKNEKSKFSW